MDANKKGRFFNYLARQSPGSLLLQLNHLSSYSLYNLLISSAFLVSCTNIDECGNPGTTYGQIPASDSLELRTSGILIDTDGGAGGQLDLFIFDASKSGTLESHRRLSCTSDTTVIYRGNGDKTAVAIAGFPFEFRLEALQKLESLEQLELEITYDNPSIPVRSGVCEFTAGQDCRINTTALLCSIELSCVRNLCGRQFLLENPCIFLSGANNSVELLRYTGFRQREPSRDTLRTPLPHDIGIAPFNSGQRLYCYPNDDPSPGLGNPQTTLVLECRINGCRKEFPAPLPPMGRGAGIKVSYEISGESEYSYSIF